MEGVERLLPSKRVKIPTKINFEGNTYSSPSDIANSFNKFFTTVAVKITSHLEPPSVDNVPVLTENKLNTPSASPKSVSKIISKLNNSKGIGLDELSVKTIKIFCKSAAFVKSLSGIINFSFRTGCFPNIWKKARVVPIFKSGDIHNIDNYRPVSVLCCLSKIIERVAFNHMYSFLTKEGLLHKFQSGFRRIHSTTTTLLHLINTIYTDMDNSLLTGALFLDLSKAFDTVNNIMLAKIKVLNPDEQLVSWLKSYLESRTQVVDFDGKLSEPATITTGVPVVGGKMAA